MEQLSANAIMALLPELTYQVPYFGEVDFRMYVGAALTFVVLTIFFWLLRMVVLQRVKWISSHTKTDIDDVLVEIIQSINAWVYTIVALYASLQFFTLPSLVDKALTALFLFAIVWQLIEVAARAIDFFAKRFLAKDMEEGPLDPNAVTASHLVTLIAKIVLWALGGLFVLSNLGIEVTSLIAGLGIGGIAVAFALQGVLSDLFASFSIYFDKPFRVGDFIIIGTDMGVVESIGIKSTRIRTLQGQELVVSNAELTTARVNNYKKMDERRIVMQFGVTYETSADNLKAIPELVKDMFEKLENARLDRVHFATYGDFALIYELVYYVTSPDYNQYMDIQQDFNFKLLDALQQRQIEFAYPTQMIYTKKVE